MSVTFMRRPTPRAADSRYALEIWAGLGHMGDADGARGQFTMGGGYAVWIDALVGQVVMWSPVLFCEALRRNMPARLDRC